MWWWLACAPDSADLGSHGTDVVPEPTGLTGETAGGTGDTGGTGSASHSGEPTHSGWAASTADTGPPEPDPCAGPPPTRFGARSTLGQVRRSEEFAFDTAGNLVNAAEGAGVFLTTYTGNPSLVSAYRSWELAGARVTPDGRALALCDEAAGRIVAIDLQTAGEQVLASGLPSPNSIGFDLRGWLYVAAFGQVTRYRSPTAAPEVLLRSAGVDFDGIAFAPDDSAVYWNADSRGDIWAAQLDAAGEVIGVDTRVHLSVGWAELDGMTTDVCGNLYVVATDGSLTRIRTDHTLETLVAPTGRYTTAVMFGSGFGGFERDHLYLMDRDSGLLDLELGIEGRREPHYPP